MYKPLADSTLLRMPKKEIIELLRTAEHNTKVSQEWVNQQAKNLKDWKPVVHERWEMRPTGMATDTGPEYKAYCTICNEPNKQYRPPFCPHCGAKMDGGADHEDD